MNDIFYGGVGEEDWKRCVPRAMVLLQSCSKIIVITGAGVSVSCGIPDFRSGDGLYGPPDRRWGRERGVGQASLFHIDAYVRDPRPFIEFAKLVLSKAEQPTPAHRFIKLLEEQGKLLRVYSQNVDSLEKKAGICRVVQCHGTLETGHCIKCGMEADSAVLRSSILKGTVTYCSSCNGIVKPDVILVGEGIPQNFKKSLTCDLIKCDLLVVIGSSLSVHPVSAIPSQLRRGTPMILINKTKIDPALQFDAELIGDCDIITRELSSQLWSAEAAASSEALKAKEIVGYPPQRVD